MKQVLGYIALAIVTGWIVFAAYEAPSTHCAQLTKAGTYDDHGC